MKCIIYTRPDDGGLSIVRPTPQFISDWVDEQHAIDHILYFDVPKDAIDVQVMDDVSIPVDRSFRGAWVRHKDGGIAVDMPKARDIHRDRMRAARAPKLAELDVAFQRALEDGKAKTDVTAAKRALRDVTKHPGIDKAKTPDDLKAVWPDILTG